MDYINLIIPEIFLAISIMSLLMIGVFYKNSFNFVYKLTIIVLFFTIILLFNHSTDTSSKIFNGSYTIDYLSLFMKTLTLVACILVMLSSFNYIKSIKINKIEYPILILSSTLGMMIMISSYDLIVFYMGLELQS